MAPGAEDSRVETPTHTRIVESFGQENFGGVDHVGSCSQTERSASNKLKTKSHSYFRCTLFRIASRGLSQHDKVKFSFFPCSSAVVDGKPLYVKSTSFSPMRLRSIAPPGKSHLPFDKSHVAWASCAACSKFLGGRVEKWQFLPIPPSIP